MKYLKWFVGILAITFGVPLFLEFFIFRNAFPSALSNSEWASFLGSFLGGVVSLIGIFITIKFTQAENKKDRELMYRPHVRVTKCQPTKEHEYIAIMTAGTYIPNGKNCSIAIRIKNVGLGPVFDFKLRDFVYTHSNGTKTEPTIKVTGDILEREEELEIWFEFNLDVHDSDLDDIDPKDTVKAIPFTQYGGDLRFVISGHDICEYPYAQSVMIHVQGQIGEENGKLKYMPEVYLR